MLTDHIQLYIINYKTLQDGQRLDLATDRSGITEADYRNGILYEEAIVEIKDILKDRCHCGRAQHKV